MPQNEIRIDPGIGVMGTFRANIDDIEMLNKSLDDILISATLEV